MIWALEIESTIYTIIKTKARARLVEEYPTINFTNDNVVSDTAVFPTVYIHFLPSMEIGQDIDNVDVNAIRATAQIEITVGNAQNSLTDARKVVSVVLEEFKALRFNITAMPEFNGNTTDTKRMIFRASRVIGSQDTF